MYVNTTYLVCGEVFLKLQVKRFNPKEHYCPCRLSDLIDYIATTPRWWPIHILCQNLAHTSPGKSYTVADNWNVLLLYCDTHTTGRWTGVAMRMFAGRHGWPLRLWWVPVDMVEEGIAWLLCSNYPATNTKRFQKFNRYSTVTKIGVYNSKSERQSMVQRYSTMEWQVIKVKIIWQTREATAM